MGVWVRAGVAVGVGKVGVGGGVHGGAVCELGGALFRLPHSVDRLAIGKVIGWLALLQL